MRGAGACGGRIAAAPVLVACVVTLGVAGCGSSTPALKVPAPALKAPALKAPCRTGPRGVAARLLGVAAGTVSAVSSVGNNGSPQCSYTAGRRSLVVNVDVTPQAYFIVERMAVEASQQFAPIPQANLPVQVPGVGLEAFWYPVLSELQTTDGVRVIGVTVTVPGTSRGRLIADGRAMARPYLGALHPPP